MLLSLPVRFPVTPLYVSLCVTGVSLFLGAQQHSGELALQSIAARTSEEAIILYRR